MRLVGLVVLLLGPARASFIVSEGNCWVNASCVHSPNWPQNYDHDVECTFRPATSGWLDVASFHIEAHHSCFWDHVTVQGTQYCDDIGPQGVAVTPNTTMSFVSELLLTALHRDASNARSLHTDSAKIRLFFVKLLTTFVGRYSVHLHLYTLNRDAQRRSLTSCGEFGKEVIATSA